MSSILVRRGIYGLRCSRWLKCLLWFSAPRFPPFVVTKQPDIVLFYGAFFCGLFVGSSFLSVIKSLLCIHWLLLSKNISNFQIASFFYPRMDASKTISFQSRLFEACFIQLLHVSPLNYSLLPSAVSLSWDSFLHTVGSHMYCYLASAAASLPLSLPACLCT